ncbi:MAG TPA: hypothetical protein VNY05_36235 [Candidatus Acidoferrales bacterium]|nr:hypothetical protein [Candidatus Acidoferrales bacterium]
MLRRLLAVAALLTASGVSAGRDRPLQRAAQAAPVATNPYEGQAAAEKAGAVAVGMRVASHPPRGSVRARLAHTALTLDG